MTESYFNESRRRFLKTAIVSVPAAIVPGALAAAQSTTPAAGAGPLGGKLTRNGGGRHARSINDFLANSARTDLIGPEMWSAPDNESRTTKTEQPDLFPDSGISAQQPHQSWQAPVLGLADLWCYGHQTNLSDIIQVQIDCVTAGQPVTCRFKPSRHHWTPAGTTTYFRSLPSGAAGEYPYAGLLSVKERKCITPDNVFVSELTLVNDSRQPKSYRISVLTPHFKTGDVPAKRIVSCKTVVGAVGKEMPIEGEAALIVKSGDPEATVISLKPQESQTYSYAFALDPQGFPAARQRAQATLDNADFFKNNARHFDNWCAQNIPALDCDNPDLLKLYYYRWFLVYRGHHDPKKVLPQHSYKRSAFYESPMGRWFGAVVGLPVPMHIQEAAWLRDPAWGADQIRNWAEIVNNQYRSFIQFTPHAIWTYIQNHPDHKLLAEVYPAISKYVAAGVSPQDASKLPVSEGSWRVFGDYQPNFVQFTTPPWDWRCDVEGHNRWGLPMSKLTRLDEAAFGIGNMQAAARIAAQLGLREDEAQHSKTAHVHLDKLKTSLWDPKTQFFYSAHPETGALADQAPCQDSFTPFMWNLVSGEPYLKAFEKFFDPAWFWAEFPITTIARWAPMYWSGNCLTGPEQASETNPHHYECCCNGPTWYFPNSLAAEALGAAASTLEGAHLRQGWLEFMSRWMEMHFLYGDRSVPCALEHVRPTDGARFRAIVDYFHSAWIDPFMRYWAGIRPDVESKSIVFDPFTAEVFTLSHVCVLGKELTFTQQYEGDSVIKTICATDGKVLARSEGTQPLVFSVAI